MGRFTRTLSPLFILTGAVAVWLAVMVTVSASAGPARQGGSPVGPAAPAQAAKATPSGGFVGEETCLTCHEDMKKGYYGSPHSRTRNPRTPAATQACESCHGPGQAHVEGAGDKTKIKNPKVMAPREVS